MEIQRMQYALICSSRHDLLTYLETFSTTDLTKRISSFPKSVRELLLHNADVYNYWVGNVWLEREFKQINPLYINSVQECRTIFQAVDYLMDDFFKYTEASFTAVQKSDIPEKEHFLELSPLQVFTHVITHEFHHKGQLLTMGRLLGYPPPDTDIIRIN